MSTFFFSLGIVYTAGMDHIPTYLAISKIISLDPDIKLFILLAMISETATTQTFQRQIKLNWKIEIQFATFF